MEGSESDSSREERNPYTDDPEVTRLLREIRRSGRLAGASIVGCGLLACAIMLGALSVCIYQGPADWRWATLLWGIIAGTGIIVWNLFARKRRADCIRRLASFRDKRIVPVLLAATQSPDHADDYSTIRAALLRSLPELDEGDQVLLSPIFGAGFRYRLQTTEAAIVCALLDAIGRTGAIRTLPDVEWLLKSRAERQYAPIRDSAAACAEALRKRIAHNRSAQALLRSADPSTQKELLRPAESSPTSEPDRLLRPPSDQL